LPIWFSHLGICVIKKAAVSLFLGSAVIRQILICPSGVPTGNGELAKSQFSGYWPTANFIYLFSLLQKLYLNTEVK